MQPENNDQPSVTPNTEVQPTAPMPSAPTEVTTPAPSPATPVVSDTPLAAAPAPVVAPNSKFGFLARLKKKPVVLALAIAAPLLLIGGGAGAYYGVILPSKPENVLKAAIANTLQQKSVTFDGTLDLQAVDPKQPKAMPATKVVFKGGTNLEAQASQADVTVNVSGFKVQAELRYLDKTAYVKFGDLSSVKGLANAYSPSIGPILDQVQNQWIEIDETVQKQANLDCATNNKFVVSEDELKMLSDAYDKNKFAVIKSQTSDKVNNAAATKFDLEIDDKKAAEYGKNFDNLEFVKKIKECTKDKTSNKSDDIKDGDKTNITIWVDKAHKRIVKLAFASDAASEKKDNAKGSLSVVLGYDQVKVEKPSGAKSVMELLSSLGGIGGGLE